MSEGIVLCSACRREVHQDGPFDGLRYGWRHCEDKSAICEGAHAQYPALGERPRGKYCGIDAMSWGKQ